jgi:hypothetical protein
VTARQLIRFSFDQVMRRLYIAWLDAEIDHHERELLGSVACVRNEHLMQSVLSKELVLMKAERRSL